jgi:hypothetical protein
MRKILALLGVLTSTAVLSAPIADYSFKSPAFNGVGYSSHVLTIENQEFTRQKAAQDAIQAALDKAKADAANTNMSKFLNNLESRVYAQISQNLASAMFASNGQSSDGGTFVMTYVKNADGTYKTDNSGNKIPETYMTWSRTLEGLSMTTVQPGQSPTTIVVPLGQFAF